MIHFRTKDNILAWLERHCPRKAVVRSLLQNGAELLGGFTSIPPSGRAGWIVRVRSVFGKKTWLVAVVPNEKKTDYEIRILIKVPWANWSGTRTSHTVYDGDKPDIYQLLKERSKT